MDSKPGYDAHGYPLYDAAWFWTQAVRPALVVLAVGAAIALLS